MIIPIQVSLTVAESQCEYSIKAEESALSFDLEMASPIIPLIYPEYEGDYTITPTEEAQVLQTTNKTLSHNIVIAPIPTNYGRTTWNGSSLHIT